MMGNDRSANTVTGMKNNNPFVFDRPVDDSDIFANREFALSWVFDNLDNEVSTPMIIEGAPGIGRTTFLKQVRKEGYLLDIVPIYVNLKELPLTSFSEFLWVFGKSVVRGLSDNGLSAPPLEKRMLVLRPWQAFQKIFWQPLMASYSGRRLLLILDNMEHLAHQSTSPETNRAYRQYLHELLEESQGMKVLASIAGRMATYDPMDIAPFHQSFNYRLSHFTEMQTYELINQNRMLDIFLPVATYIYSLTGGHPADIQRLCHAIFERMKSYNIRVVTVADVVATLRTELKPADFRRPVHHQRVKTTYAVAKEQA
jgi:KaiC/GvpD/RAD55 family RecA-like ATPase